MRWTHPEIQLAPDCEADRAVWTAWAADLPDRLDQAAVPLLHAPVPVGGRRTWLVSGPENRPVVVKRYAFGADAHIGEMAGRAFARQMELFSRSQPVPEPLLFFAVETGASPAWYAVSRLLEGCAPLSEFAFEHLRRHACAEATLRGWIRDGAAAVAALHRAGYIHGDLHQQNILVKKPPHREHLQFFWTDFDACERIAERWPCEAHLRDLATLGASMFALAPDGELRRGLSEYLALAGLDAQSRRQARRIVADAHRYFLSEFRRSFEMVEQHCLAAAEQALDTEAAS